MKAAQVVTGGDVIRLMQMPLGPLWRDRGLLLLEAEALASKQYSKRNSAAAAMNNTATQVYTPKRPKG